VQVLAAAPDRQRCGQHRALRGTRTLPTTDLQDQGKTRTVYVPLDLVDEVRQWLDEHKRIKQLLHEISQLSLALVQTHAQHQKRRRGRP